MKKFGAIYLSALLIAFFAGFGAQAEALDISGSRLEVFVADISPNPVEPGQDILLNVILKNSGSGEALDTTAVLKAAYPFTIKTVQNEVSKRNLCVDCSVNIVYSISTDASAVSGSYPVEFEASYGTSTTRIVEKKTIDINVIGVPRLTLEANVSEKVSPNSRFGADFEFKNIGTGDARDIKISTTSQDFVIAGGTPIINSLKSAESEKIIVDFIASPNLAANVYSIPITLNYIDELGASRESTSSFGISVFGNSDLTVKSVKVEPTPVYLGDDFTVTVRMQNIGYGDAKEVVIELDAPYTGYKKAFIGKLAKDEDAPAIFNLKANSLSSDAKLTIKYRDDFGEHEKTENIAINVSKVSNNTLYYLFLAAAGAAAYVYRKRILKLLKKQQ